MRLLLPLSFSWPCPCVVMLMSPCYHKHPPLIVLFDLPLILLIRSPTFKVKRFASTSKCVPAHVCVYMCVHARENKIKWHKDRQIVIPFPLWTWHRLCWLQGMQRERIHLTCRIHYINYIIGKHPHQCICKQTLQHAPNRCKGIKSSSAQITTDASVYISLRKQICTCTNKLMYCMSKFHSETRTNIHWHNRKDTSGKAYFLPTNLLALLPHTLHNYENKLI